MTCMECTSRRASPYSQWGGLYDCALTGKPILRPTRESCPDGKLREDLRYGREVPTDDD